MKTLTIISHTEHYKRSDNTLVGWGPTVTEINNLLLIFDKIYHVAMLYSENPPPSALPYNSENIIFVALPPLGGPKFIDKLRLIYGMPNVTKLVNRTINKTDYFQLRVPTGIGVFLIPYLIVFAKNKGWFKYAGNWNQKNPPLGYQIQRWMLKKQSRKVTINGKWHDQPTNCLTFENPCLNEGDIYEGNVQIKNKKLDEKLTFCYVGRLEKPKGVERIILAFKNLEHHEKRNINKVHLVGNGIDANYFKSIADYSGVQFVFHGYLPREEVFQIYKESHFFIMPTTASEGFPKVIAEAMNFGCIPIVSLVSSIGQYIKHLDTGICINPVNRKTVLEAIRISFSLSQSDYEKIVLKQKHIIKLFSFKHYNNRITNDLL